MFRRGSSLADKPNKYYGEVVDLKSVTYNFILGIGDAGISTMDGIIEFLNHPIFMTRQVLDAIGFIAKALDDPFSEEGLMLASLAVNMALDIYNNNANEQARLIGSCVGEILLSLIADKGISKITEAIKVLKAYSSSGKLVNLVDNVTPGVTKVDNYVDDVAKVILRRVDRVLDEILDSAIISRVKEIRSLLTSDLKRSGNLATANVEISGLKSEFYAHNQIDVLADARSAADKVADISLKPSNPVFKASEEVTADGRIVLRDIDSEYKILNDIANKLGDNVNASGKIKLFTELKCCPSCDNVTFEFLQKYKNIEIEVINNNGTRLIP